MRAWAHRHLALLIGVGLCLAFAVSIYSFMHANDRRRSACIDLEALKTITRDEKREQNARAMRFLRANPQGVPGIPRRLIVEDIRQRKHVVKQLAAKSC